MSQFSAKISVRKGCSKSLCKAYCMAGFYVPPHWAVPNLGTPHRIEPWIEGECDPSVAVDRAHNRPVADQQEASKNAEPHGTVLNVTPLQAPIAFFHFSIVLSFYRTLIHMYYEYYLQVP